MKTTYLLDGDGVTIGPHEFFSRRLIKKGAPEDKVLAFFRGVFRQCMIGKADLKEELAPLLPAWGWSTSLDDLLKEWFEGERGVNEAVLDQVKTLRDRGHRCYLVADQERYRAAYILGVMGFKDRFDGAFFSHQLGVRKENPAFFTHVLAGLKVPASSVVCWDDDADNVAAAQSIGIRANVFDPEQTNGISIRPHAEEEGRGESD